jgi:hypothetical protein
MVEDTRTGKWKKVIFIIVGIMIVLFILIGLFAGLSNLRKFFTYTLIGLLVIVILFALIYLFWLIFIKKEFKDIPASYRKKLIQTSKLMKNEMLGNLYLSGDHKHNRIKLGKFAYLRIKLPKMTKSYIDQKQQGSFGVFHSEKEVETTIPVDIDCFVLLKQGIFDKLFGEPVFILIKPEDHNFSSIFNDVTINGFNLVPLDSYFFSIDKRNLDADITKALASNYIKEVVWEIFRDLDKLVKQSINIDEQHQKSKEKMLQFDMPQLGNQEQQK